MKCVECIVDVRKRGSQFVLVDRSTGKVEGRSRSRRKAEASARIRNEATREKRRRRRR